MASQASMWEERAHKLQEEVKLRSELATMWKRSAEKGGGGERGELEAAALTWKVEAERATSEGVRLKELVKRAEASLAIKEEELLRARADGEAQRLALERLAQQQRHVERDRDDPRDEIAQALASAQEDLHAKTEEARHLSSKVARLEAAISQIM